MAVADAASSTLPDLDLTSDSRTRWFSPIGSVHFSGDEMRVFVGDVLIAQFSRDAVVERDLVLTALASGPQIHLGQLAKAFDISSEMLRRVRRTREQSGVEALVVRGRRGPSNRLDAKQVAKVEVRFAAGASINEVLAVEGRRWGVSRSTIARAQRAWKSREASVLTPTTPPAIEPSPQLPLEHDAARQTAPAFSAARTDASDPVAPASVEEVDGRDDSVREDGLRSSSLVQHAGSWLLLAVVTQLGLHDAATAFQEHRATRAALRIALDACIVAFAIAEKCVEGVRRLATPSGGALLRADHAPAATWVRGVLGMFAADGGGARFHLRMLGNYLRALQRPDGQTEVFYVDNHLRRYTGQEVIRRGWRMQDKRVVPGTTDFHLHDVDGNPLFRFSSPEHASLTEYLAPVARLLRLALGPNQKIALVFDRGGSFPNAMASLRDEGFEFITYERKPYPQLMKPAFDKTVVIDDETYGLCEAPGRNLRSGRGRVRRIAVRAPDGHQINILAVSDQPAEWLVERMFGRWVQENAFKHGAERWGINQLDGRVTEEYPPDAVIPNPARRRLSNALRVARIREGDARRHHSRLASDDPKREKWEREIAESIDAQKELETRLPSTPQRARVEDTELAGTLVKHKGEYKLAIDTVRIACANAEADLAELLATHMKKPGEAKRALRNLFMAPGRVCVNGRSVTVELMPPGTRSELAAFDHLLEAVNARKLTLPGDSEGRRLVFKSQPR